MPKLNRYKYYLKNELGEYYYIDSSGALNTQVSPIEIPFAPKAWDSKVIEWVRGFDSFGVVTSMTDSLDYTLDAAKILRSLVYTYGANAYCELYIEFLNDTTQTYSYYFSGKIDAKEIVDKFVSVSADASGDGYLEKIKENESTNYDIDLDNSFYVRMPGITLQSKIKLATTNEKPPFHTFYNDIAFNQILQISLTEIDNDGGNIVGYLQGQYSAISQNVANQPLPVKENWLMSINRDADLTMDWDFRIALRNQGSNAGTQDDIKLNIMLNRQNKAGGFSTHLLYQTPNWQANNGSTTIYNIDSYATIIQPPQLNAGDKIYFSVGVVYTSFPTYNNWQYDIAIEAGEIGLLFESKSAETYIEAKRPNDLFSEIIDKASDSSVVGESAYLDSIDDYVVVSGNSLRALPDSVIKTNFKDFFKSYGNIFSLGHYYDKVNKKHIILPKGDLFDATTQILDLGELSDIEITQKTDLLFGKLVAGYPEIEIEGLNGKEAYNCQFVFSSPISSESELDITSTYIADPYEIEVYRINLEGQTTTTSNEDNKNYIIRIEQTPAGTYNGRDYYDIKKYILSGSTGLTYPNEVYNLDITPKRIIINNWSLIKGILSLMDSESLIFNTADRNENVAANIGFGTVVEKEDVPLSATYFTTPMFKNFVITAKTGGNNDLFTSIESNPYGYVTAKIYGETIKGFLISAMENPESKASQEIQLLLTEDTDLTKLIR